MENISQLTQRQIQILKAVIEEYIATAEAVGSETLEKKYNLVVSPATIRNEMVRLTHLPDGRRRLLPCGITSITS